MERKGYGHVMSPCDPRKQAYTYMLRKFMNLGKEHPEFWDYLEQVENFEKIFELDVDN
jgi:hypothetical protein